MDKTMSKKSTKQNSKSRKKSAGDEPQAVSSFHTFLVFIRYNAFGRFLAGLLVLILVILFNIALSQNNLETFALITGIEMVIGMIIAWTSYLLKRNADQEIEEETEN